MAEDSAVSGDRESNNGLHLRRAILLVRGLLQEWRKKVSLIEERVSFDDSLLVELKNQGGTG
jgi:hypothetical protein